MMIVLIENASFREPDKINKESWGGKVKKYRYPCANDGGYRLQANVRLSEKSKGKTRRGCNEDMFGIKDCLLPSR